MNHVLAVSDGVQMVPVASKDFKEGSNQGTVENQPIRKSYREGGRNSQANLVHLCETKPV